MSSILFVSHDPDLRAVALRVLGRAGCQVTTAAHGGHALLACASGRPVDVLVIEDELPEGPGRIVAERLRRLVPELGVVRMCKAGTEPPAEGVVVRPFTADDLIDAIVQTVAGQARRGATSR